LVIRTNVMLFLGRICPKSGQIAPQVFRGFGHPEKSQPKRIAKFLGDIAPKQPILRRRYWPVPALWYQTQPKNNSAFPIRV
jgi:hypothetical protein